MKQLIIILMAIFSTGFALALDNSNEGDSVNALLQRLERLYPNITQGVHYQVEGQNSNDLVIEKSNLGDEDAPMVEIWGHLESTKKNFYLLVTISEHETGAAYVFDVSYSSY